MAYAPHSRSGGMFSSLLITLIGAGLLLIAGKVASDRYDFVSEAKVAQGLVSELNAGGAHPQIDFTSIAGEKISYPQGGFIFGYQIGQPVRVLYAPERPANSAIIDDPWALWATPAVIGGLGLLFVICGVPGLIRRKPRRVTRGSLLKGL